jgi:hypothetical protein
LDVSDLQVVLNEEGHAVFREMPGEQHRGSVRMMERLFLTWVGNQDNLHNSNMLGEKEANVFLNDSVDKNAKRCPDFAIFSETRLDEEGDIGAIKSVGKYMNPRVIFQFSWGNEILIGKEKDAVDDMMMYAGLGEYQRLGRPNVAYLIKALRRGTKADSLVLGFDVYEVHQDGRTAEDPSIKYRVGGQEDAQITLDPVDMGLPANSECESFVIPLHGFRVKLEKLGVEFVAADGNRNET